MILGDSKTLRITIRREVNPDIFVGHIQDDQTSCQLEVLIDGDEAYHFEYLLQCIETRIKQWVGIKEES